MSNAAIDMNSVSTLPRDNDILGVIIKPLKTHSDGRGFFREVIRVNDPFFIPNGFNQWSHSKMQKDVVKAWHYHHIQYDWWYVALGQVTTVLFDNRPESPTFKKKLEFKMGDSAEYGADTNEICLCIPPGVLHGLRVTSDFAHLFYITSQIYNPQEEGRFKFDSELVPHNWGPDAIVAENDKRDFVPVAKRIPLKS